jgi:uncharacterized membrane protein HdeD (DUF308 family)
MKNLENLTKRWWRFLAVAIIMVAAGPEVFIYAEGMVILEAIGASTFVFMYVVGFKLYFHDAWSAFSKFENQHHVFSLPSLPMIKESPGLLYYAIPRRSINYASLLIVSSLALLSVKIIVA